MAPASRSAQFAKVHKVLKKHYKPVFPSSDRPVLEHLLFACCLENTHYEKAEETFAALVHTFFDWNEIRVTTIRELSEVMAGLPDPSAAAHRVKRVLQHVFECSYRFDLEELRKKNLGTAVERLKKISGVTTFGVAYVVQSALGGHAVPVDAGALAVLRIVELVSDKDVGVGTVPGLERAIAKSKGVEFGSLLHQLGADFTANPYVPALHKILLQINPDVQGQLPKRRARQQPPAPVGAPQQERKPKPRAKLEPPPETAAPPKPEPEKAKTRGKKKPPSQQETAAHAPTEAAQPAPPPAAERKPRATKEKPPSSKRNVKAEDRILADSPLLPERSATAGLSKRKPR